ncbi:MAG: hypothetical protein KF698_08150 [Anaerolineales bacterium]|nr:hypothetical protein [Anaerolineales bacterium]
MSKRIAISKNSYHRAEAVYTAILQFIRENGYPPTIRELCAKTDITSTSVMVYYLDMLEDVGAINRKPKDSRAIEVVGMRFSMPDDNPLMEFNPRIRRNMGMGQVKQSHIREGVE